jgi:hypothetical protein
MVDSKIIGTLNVEGDGVSEISDSVSAMSLLGTETGSTSIFTLSRPT